MTLFNFSYLTAKLGYITYNYGSLSFLFQALLLIKLLFNLVKNKLNTCLFSTCFRWCTSLIFKFNHTFAQESVCMDYNITRSAHIQRNRINPILEPIHGICLHWSSYRYHLTNLNNSQLIKPLWPLYQYR